jgi:hypothetical protein
MEVAELSKLSGVPILTAHLMDQGEGDSASIRDFAAIATALGVELDPLVPWTAEGEQDSEQDSSPRAIAFDFEGDT